MKLKKLLVPVIIAGCLLTGCAKPIYDKQFEDEVKITYMEYKPSEYKMRYNPATKSWVPYHTDEEYFVEVKYDKDGHTSYFYDKYSYEAVKDKKIGDNVKALVHEYLYENKDVKYTIESLEK